MQKACALVYRSWRIFLQANITRPDPMLMVSFLSTPTDLTLQPGSWSTETPALKLGKDVGVSWEMQAGLSSTIEDSPGRIQGHQNTYIYIHRCLSTEACQDT